MKFVTAYGEHEKVTVKFRDEEGNHDGMTEQHHKDAVDIHNIIHKYDTTGLITHVSVATAQYGDFTGVTDYREALHKVMQADESFSQLPAKVRQQFNNDPGEFFEFAMNPDNAEALADLGLANRPEKPTAKVDSTPQSEGSDEA